MTKRRLLICNTLEREVSQLVEGGQHGDVEVMAYPAICGSDAAEGAAIERVLDRASQVGAPPACVLGCCTLERMIEQGEPGGPRSDQLQLATATRCFDMLLDPALVSLLVEQGAYLVTPGWLSGWRHRLERWGLDQASAPPFFQEVARKIVLLDTGSAADAEARLSEFAVFTGLPAERLEVGVDELARFVDRALEHDAQSDQSHEGASDAGAGEAVADAHGAAAELLVGLMRAHTADQVVEAVLSCFAALCHPTCMLWVPVAGGTPHPWPPRSEIDEAMWRRAERGAGVPARLVGDAGLVLRFGQGGDEVAVLWIEGVAEPAQRQEQLAFACKLMPACAAALTGVVDREALPARA